MKLRKHIRTRRLTAVEQLACDRCVIFTFGRGENAFHLVLELYVSGNLLLTDHEYRILALLRTHADEHSKVAIRQVYPRDSAIGLLHVPIEEFPDAIDGILNVASQRQENQELKEVEADDDKAKTAGGKGPSAFAKRSKKRVTHSAMPLVQLLHKLAPFADPGLCAASVSKALASVGEVCENAFKLTVDDYAFEDVVGILQKAAELALETLRSVSRPGDLGGGSMPVLEAAADADAEGAGEEEDDDDDEPPPEAAPADGAGSPADAAAECPGVVIPGWILRRRVHVPPTEPYWANDEFTPLPPAGPPGGEKEALSHFATFHKCVDEFYTKLEEHRAAEQKAQHAKTVFDKVERIRADQGRRVEQLEAEQSLSERQALLIEANAELVERALVMVNTMLASQIDWGDLWREVKRQQRLGHPIAQHIHALNLERNEMQFLLSGLDGEDDSDGEEDQPMQVVPLDLNLSLHANVALLHSKRKETRDKTSRTLQHAEQAIKSAERKAQQDLQKFQLKQTIRRVRQTWWFEKFFWFVSSENYVVVAGHDAQQTEQIFSRHIGKNDVFVQVDVSGARSCFIRNPGGGEVPPATLREAGTMSLCHSAAWDKRIRISAWWVPVAQVTRGGPPPEGDFVLVDGFAVRGRRHFMPPLHLEMGLTLLFHIGDASLPRHRGERRSRYLEAMAGDTGANAASATAGDEEEEEEGDDSDDGSVEENGDDRPRDDGPEENRLPEAPEATDAAADPAASRQAGEEDAEAEEAEEAEATAEVEEADEATAEAPADASDGDAGSTAQATAAEADGRRSARARVSKAERRKQQRKDDGASNAAGSQQGDDDAGPTTPSAASEPFRPPARAAAAAAPGVAKASAKPLPRGQRAKAKKIKEKYADQDEEERLLRLALTGSKQTKLLASQQAPSAEVDDAPPKGADRSLPDGGVSAEQEPSDAVPARASAEPPPTDGHRGARARPPAQRKEAEVRLTPGCDAEEGGPSFTQFEQLDLLTGQPQPDDEVLYAMAMVAPYCALGGPYTYRAKLTPGSGKKGQMAKQVLKMFEAQMDKQAWRMLVQAIPENDTAGLMMGSCKVSMPGLQKLQQQLQKDKKSEKRERAGAAVR